MGTGGTTRQNYKLFVILLILLFFTFTKNIVCGQQSINNDSLLIEGKIKNIAENPQIDVKKGLLLSQEILDASEKINYKKGIANGLYYLGKYYDKTGDKEKSGEFLQKALQLSKENHLQKEEGKTLLLLGFISHRKSDDNTAFSFYTQALNNFKLINDTFGMAMSYHNIADCFLNQVTLNQSLDNFNKAIELYKLIKRPHEFGLLYWDISLLYFRHQQYETGVKYLRESINILNQINDTITLCSPLNTMASYFQDMHQYDSAAFYYSKTFRIAENTGNKRQEAIALLNMGIGYFENGKLKQAEVNFKKALPIAKDLAYKELIIEVWHSMAVLYAKMEDYKSAYRYYDTAYINMDSFRNEEKEQAMAEMTARFNNTELQAKNKLLQKENDLKQVKLHNKNVLVYCGLGAMILLLVIGFQKVRHDKLSVNQKLLQLEQKQLLAQMNPHFIFNCLNSIQQFVVQNDADNANKYLADFAMLMRQTLDNSKDGIIPLKREIEYLENYLSLECMRFENKFRYSINCGGDVNINTVEIPSMIIQPFVENAIHHGLRNLEDIEGCLIINFYLNKDNLYCEVDDNGIGMEESQRLKEQRFIKYQSHGMELTRQRLALVSKMNSADYQISVQNKTNEKGESEGTRIVIKFPIKA